MIPYIDIPTFKLFGLLPIQPFGVLVGIGLVVGYMLGRRRARLHGLDPHLCADGMVWTVVGGFIVAHLVSVVFYFPERILENPLVLLAFWSGLSSFGGFIGGILGAIVFFRRQKVSMLEYSDAIIFGMVPGWFFGRLGCTVVHDHPGSVTTFFMGVKYPPHLGGKIHHDLGLYEMLYTIPLTGILYALKDVRPFYGFHSALMLLLYAPVRFGFDYLRTADKHYLGLTPGQYLAIGIALFAVGLMGYGLRLKARGIAPGKQSLTVAVYGQHPPLRPDPAASPARRPAKKR